MVRATAYTNIAIVKYWGKHPAWEELHVPTKSSLSFTVRDFYTETEVKLYSGSGKIKRFSLNNREVVSGSKEWRKVQLFIDKLKTFASKDFALYDYEIISKNNFPTAAGFASSASGFAALVKSLLQALSVEHSWAEELLHNERKLSALARLGSGSASRSVGNGVRVWWRGWDKEDFNPLWDSFSEKVLQPPKDLVIIYVMVETQEKKISSREGMKQSIRTSPFYWYWVELEEALLWEALHYLKNGSWDKLFPLIIKFSNNFHAICRSTYPPIEYLNERSLSVIQRVIKFNEEYGPYVAYTFDAGPNPVIFTTKDLLLDVKKNVLEDLTFKITTPV